MEWLRDEIVVQTGGKGLFPITREIQDVISRWQVREGMLHLFIPHTSASLVINESYDPSARQDLEVFLDRLAPEGEDWHRHTLEGKDDSPSHMRSILTSTSLSIPIDGGELCLGTWQGVYLAENRSRPHRRRILIRCLKVE
jgi:secondary thiamine-phosphate synthase enzyme